MTPVGSTIGGWGEGMVGPEVVAEGLLVVGIVAGLEVLGLPSG